MEQGGQFARPVPDRVYVRLSAAAASAVASAPSAFAGSIGSASLAAMRVVPVPALVPTVLPAPMPAPAVIRTTSVPRRHMSVAGSVLVRPRHPGHPMMMTEAEPGEHRAPDEPRTPSRPRGSRVGRTRE